MSLQRTVREQPVRRESPHLMSTLSGRTVALFESRLSKEMATLVRRLDGVAITAPTVVEVPRLDDFNVFMDGMAERRFSLSVFLTGAGTTILLREAERRERLNEAVTVLGQMTLVCRGPKPLAALKRVGLRANVTTGRPHTTHELIQALESVALRDRGVLLVHYGEKNHLVADALQARGARVDNVCPYEWALPEDTAPIERVISEAIARRLDAVLFTSQIQCRHLFEVATHMGVAEGLAQSLNRDTVVGAIGPVCAETLRSHGVVPDVMPPLPNMMALIAAVADYFDLTQGTTD
jgi:uroporphyrinogen-III synthase